MRRLPVLALLSLLTAVGLLVLQPPVRVRAQVPAPLKLPISYTFRLVAQPPPLPPEVFPLVQVPPGQIIRVTGVSMVNAQSPDWEKLIRLVEASSSQFRWSPGVMNVKGQSYNSNPKSQISISEPGVIFSAGETLGIWILNGLGGSESVEIAFTGWVESWPQ